MKANGCTTREARERIMLRTSIQNLSRVPRECILGRGLASRATRGGLETEGRCR
jgi:hypothetical protein